MTFIVPFPPVPMATPYSLSHFIPDTTVPDFHSHSYRYVLFRNNASREVILITKTHTCKTKNVTVLRHQYVNLTCLLLEKIRQITKIIWSNHIFSTADLYCIRIILEIFAHSWERKFHLWNFLGCESFTYPKCVYKHFACKKLQIKAISAPEKI